MSKGNMLLGYASGSVGDLVFARQKGQQVTKARNRNPFNPKTNGQMAQRATFSNSVKFFTRGVQNLFKFAFENKKPTESDFNTFMRLNRDNGCIISRKGFDVSSYPALGKYIMSRGSLATPVIYTETDSDNVSFESGTIGDYQTVGEFSKGMMRKYSLQKGDIVTFLQIIAQGSNWGNTPSVYPDEREQVLWLIKQMPIDPDSTIPMSTVLSGLHYNIESGIIRFFYPGNATLGAAAVIFSRNTERGLKCSTSHLVNNRKASSALELTKEEKYIDLCLETWRAEPNSILQGSIIEFQPDFPKYDYQVFIDAACTTEPQPGQRVNRLYLRFTYDAYYMGSENKYGNPDSEWQNMTIRATTSTTIEDAIEVYLYDSNFVSSVRSNHVSANEVIALATEDGSTLTLGLDLKTKFADPEIR